MLFRFMFGPSGDGLLNWGELWKLQIETLAYNIVTHMEI
jgi:hypothetical protein